MFVIILSCQAISPDSTHATAAQSQEQAMKYRFCEVTSPGRLSEKMRVFFSRVYPVKKNNNRARDDAITFREYVESHYGPLNRPQQPQCSDLPTKDLANQNLESEKSRSQSTNDEVTDTDWSGTP
jgi:hypothetical protein